MRIFDRFFIGALAFASLGSFACGASGKTEVRQPSPSPADAFLERVSRAASEARLPERLAAALSDQARTDGAAFRSDLEAVDAADPYLTYLVDKGHPLPEGYAPADLVTLANASYRVNRAGLQLRAGAARSLELMAAAARKDGVSLLVSSSYRSYQYQVTVYDRVVKELGQAAADRESAKPGRSQHQLGLAVDFGSIDDSFAETAASRWLLANACRFGWSLSFPQGYEEVTGYRWESWHYRYVGTAAASFIERRFGGIQQYALQFLDALKRVK